MLSHHGQKRQTNEVRGASLGLVAVECLHVNVYQYVQARFRYGPDASDPNLSQGLTKLSLVGNGSPSAAVLHQHGACARSDLHLAGDGCTPLYVVVRTKRVPNVAVLSEITIKPYSAAT